MADYQFAGMRIEVSLKSSTGDVQTFQLLPNGQGAFRVYHVRDKRMMQSGNQQRTTPGDSLLREVSPDLRDLVIREFEQHLTDKP